MSCACGVGNDRMSHAVTCVCCMAVPPAHAHCRVHVCTAVWSRDGFLAITVESIRCAFWMMCIEKYGHVASVQGRGALTAPTVRGTSVPARGAGGETRPARARAAGRLGLGLYRIYT
jgi:hypothetical protein